MELFVDHDAADDNARRRRRLLLMLMISKKKKIKFRDLLNEEGRRRRDRNLPLSVLPEPSVAPWACVYNCKDDGALITVTGFDHSTFQWLLDGFEPLFHAYTPWSSGKKDGRFTMKKVNQDEKRGRKRKVSSIACLGLTLAWYRFRGSEFILQGWFGFPGTLTSIWLRFGRRILYMFLFQNQEAMVTLPSDDKVKFYKEQIQERHDMLKDVYCVCDGLKLKFEACAGLMEQGMYYNGWQHGHYISNLFVFAIDGRIINAVINVPGSVHDSQVATWGDTYTKLEQVYERTDGVCCVDSAFASMNVPYLIKSAQDKTKARTATERVIMDQATSLRQAAEWGMRAIQGSMPRLKDNIHYETKGERKRILKLVPLLYNVRLARVGLNQIANTYVKAWSRDASYYIKKD